MRMTADSRRPSPPSRWGPAITPDGVRYSVWAPEREGLTVQIEAANGGTLRFLPMTRDEDGFHTALDPAGRPGDRYRFRIGEMLLPDPASRAQAGSVHEASLVVDDRAFAWTDAAWQRPRFRDLVIYELHVGTFTPEGTFRAVIERLSYLRELGVNAIELMPVVDFPGSRSWGYDGVLIYAPARAYGSPDDLRALVDAAHEAGIAVILDVVYNHFGPDGNYLACYSSRFASPKHETPWGAGFNLDDPDSAPVRDFFLQNVIYWTESFHFDGFRLDATHEIADDSPTHLLAEIVAEIHARGGYAIAEDCRNEVKMLTVSAQGGMGFDAVWADDFHHITRIAQTREQESYFRHYRGSLEELVDTLQHGWHYRGQMSPTTGKKRGTDGRHLPPSSFLHCISNHDQVGNRAFGERPSKVMSSEAYRAISALLCLSPFTPMLFMGQEWGASTPFQFFTDHQPELGKLVTEGRRREFAAFAAFRDPETLKRIPDPQAEATFQNSKLKWEEANGGILELYRECLRLRRELPELKPEKAGQWESRQLSENIGAIRIGQLLLVYCLTGYGRGEIESIENNAKSPRWRLLLDTNDRRFDGEGQEAFDKVTQQWTFRSAGLILLK